MGALALSGLLLVGRVGGQEIRLDGDRPAAAKKGHVVLLSETVEVAEGKQQLVELRFRVDPGFHINSHKPKDELLMPTSLKLEEAGGVKVLGETYPAGSPFRLAIGAGETLDVYQGEFRVGLQMVVPRGATTLTGTLHYQACDNAACFPPRSLPVRVLLKTK